MEFAYSYSATRAVELFDRAIQIFERLVTGGTNKKIAAEFHISPRTVENHRARIMEKTDARNVADLTRLAVAAGL